MQDTIKLLSEIGFTPLNIVLGVGLVALWRLNVARDAKQTADREAWHKDTREQLDEVKEHTKACEEDRIRLKAQMDILSRPCVMQECPKRNHH